MLLAVLRRWSRCCSYSELLCSILRGASCFKVFPCFLSSCFFIPFSIVTTSLGEEGAGLCASRALYVLVFVLNLFLLNWCRGLAFFIKAPMRTVSIRIKLDPCIVCTLHAGPHAGRIHLNSKVVIIRNELFFVEL